MCLLKTLKIIYLNIKFEKKVTRYVAFLLKIY